MRHTAQRSKKWYNYFMNKCNVGGCPNQSRGIDTTCSTHYQQTHLGRSPQSKDTTEFPVCSVSHCKVPANARTEGALCQEHYQLKYRGIDPESRIVYPNNAGRSYATCWVGDCDKRAMAKSLCNYHGRRARRGLLEVPAELGVNLNPPCSFEGCEHLTEANDLCHGHLTQLYTGKDLTELRAWGKYIKGQHVCGVAHCKRAAWVEGLCKTHHRAVTEYKLSPEDAIKLYDENRCFNPGCSNTTYLHIDHDHATGKARGLLCAACNKSLGFLREDRGRIRGLATYLDEFGS